MSNKQKQIKMEFTENLHILNGDINGQVKQVLAAIKDQLIGARKMVQGQDLNTVKDFGGQIVKRDEIDVTSAVFYAGFETSYYCQQISAKELIEQCKSNDLKLINVRYTKNLTSKK